MIRYYALLIYPRGWFLNPIFTSMQIEYVAQSVDLINNNNCLRAKGESDKQTAAWAVFTAVLGEPENSHEGHTLVCVCQRQTRPINEIHNTSSRGNRTQSVSFPWEPALGA